jgi:hypothetical protein
MFLLAPGTLAGTVPFECTFPELRSRSRARSVLHWYFFSRSPVSFDSAGRSDRSLSCLRIPFQELEEVGSDIQKVILSYDREIIPVLMRFKHHDEVEFPMDKVDKEAVAKWIDDRVVDHPAATFGWERYVGPSGKALGMKTFGASAPQKELQKKFGFTPEHIVAAAREQLRGRLS